MPCLSCTGDPWIGPTTPAMPHLRWVEGENHLPLPAGNALPNAAQEVVGPPCCDGVYWLVHNLVSTWAPKSFSALLLSRFWAASVFWSIVLFLSRLRALDFILGISSRLENDLAMGDTCGGADDNAVLSGQWKELVIRCFVYEIF